MFIDIHAHMCTSGDFAARQYGRFIPFCNIDPRVLDNSKDTDLTFIGHGLAFWEELEYIDANGQRESWQTTPLKGEGVVPKYMREYKNLWVDLSANSGYCAMTRDVEYAKKFLNEFWERILFGTDICYADEKPKAVLIDMLNEFQ